MKRTTAVTMLGLVSVGGVAGTMQGASAATPGSGDLRAIATQQSGDAPLDGTVFTVTDNGVTKDVTYDGSEGAVLASGTNSKATSCDDATHKVQVKEKSVPTGATIFPETITACEVGDGWVFSSPITGSSTNLPSGNIDTVGKQLLNFQSKYSAPGTDKTVSDLKVEFRDSVTKKLIPNASYTEAFDSGIGSIAYDEKGQPTGGTASPIATESKKAADGTDLVSGGTFHLPDSNPRTEWTNRLFEFAAPGYAQTKSDVSLFVSKTGWVSAQELPADVKLDPAGTLTVFLTPSVAPTTPTDTPTTPTTTAPTDPTTPAPTDPTTQPTTPTTDPTTPVPTTSTDAPTTPAATPTPSDSSTTSESGDPTPAPSDSSSASPTSDPTTPDASDSSSATPTDEASDSSTSSSSASTSDDGGVVISPSNTTSDAPSTDESASNGATSDSAQPTSAVDPAGSNSSNGSGAAASNGGFGPMIQTDHVGSTSDNGNAMFAIGGVFAALAAAGGAAVAGTRRR